MKIKWYGHSCFLITADNGVRILTDPCDESTGYILKDIETDIVTSSHDHFDHNYFAAAKGEPIILKDAGETEACGIRFLGVPTWHDKTNGSERGSNIIFVFEVDGMKIAHLGDLGHLPRADVLKELEDVDIMLAPIGGTFTIDHKEALLLRTLLQPKVMIPMHYATPDLKFELAPLQTFINAAETGRIHRLNDSEAVLTKDHIGNNRILILDYTK
ncbi:MAG: MBL fold metallo-hydrolase [Clostridia bacterium]|nr:MBL fold metallo-hydrolase [Clostridia bacterium]